VHLSVDKAERTAVAENVGLGKTMVAPCVIHARRPRTRPKQWKSGGGQQRISDDVKDIRSAIELALLMRLLKGMSVPALLIYVFSKIEDVLVREHCCLGVTC
jgi:hypothetical protein